jgi:hypothetical protein
MTQPPSGVRVVARSPVTARAPEGYGSGPASIEIPFAAGTVASREFPWQKLRSAAEKRSVVEVRFEGTAVALATVETLGEAARSPGRPIGGVTVTGYGSPDGDARLRERLDAVESVLRALGLRNISVETLPGVDKEAEAAGRVFVEFHPAESGR